MTDAFYRGQYSLIYFGFTYCPDICPNELVKVGKIVDEIERRHFKVGLKPIFISVDPARDSVGQLRHYAQDFHPNIDFLTGTNEQVGAVAKAYRVYFRFHLLLFPSHLFYPSFSFFFFLYSFKKKCYYLSFTIRGWFSSTVKLTKMKMAIIW